MQLLGAANRNCTLYLRSAERVVEALVYGQVHVVKIFARISGIGGSVALKENVLGASTVIVSDGSEWFVVITCEHGLVMVVDDDLFEAA